MDSSFSNQNTVILFSGGSRDHVGGKCNTSGAVLLEKENMLRGTDLHRKPTEEYGIVAREYAPRTGKQ